MASGLNVRRCVVLTSAVVALALPLAVSTPTAGAVFTQCPPAGLDSGCQFLITVTDAGPSVQRDPAQGPYEGVADSLMGIQNSSSHDVVSISLTASGGLFHFDGDGVCNNAHGPAPSGCQPPPGSTATCNPSTVNTNHCSFMPPPGEPPNYNEPGATNEDEQSAMTPIPPPWPNGDLQNGYEGPRNWFSNVSLDFNSGSVNFSPPLRPGESTFFAVEQPNSAVTGVVNVPFAGSSTSTVLSGDGLSGNTLTVPQGVPVTDTAHVSTATATGDVNYAVYRDSACTMLAAKRSTATVANGTAGASAPLALGPATYYLLATYDGDPVNAPSVSKCGSEVLTVAHRFNAGLPGTRRCLRGLHFHPHRPKSVQVGSVHVDANGHLLKKLVVSRSHHPRVDIRKLPGGSFHVEVILKSGKGRVYEDSRLYRHC